MNVHEVAEILAALRQSGSDTYAIEAKEASQGMPETIDETLSAFGNMPDGGLILLGVAEHNGSFEVTGVWDAKAAMEALGSKARQRIVPPLQLGAVDALTIEGHTVVTCVVPPQPALFKPFRVGQHGPSFTRSADGDYRLSPQEEQFLVGAGERPLHDRMPIAEAHIDRDIDPDLLEQYLDRQLQHAPRLSKLTRAEQLFRTNVTVDEAGTPTLAAVYALGLHPQQFLPHLCVKAYEAPAPTMSSSVRTIDQQQFSGPIPDLLEQSLEWVRRQLRPMVITHQGRGVNQLELPLVAVRELIANALVHRDLSTASMDSYIRIIKDSSKLIVSNPGGLWGIAVRQLGKTAPHARNPVLYDMCSAITTSQGHRIIEGHATGIPTIRQALNQAFLPEPYFQDRVIDFQAIVSSASVLGEEEQAWLARVPGVQSLTMSQKHALMRLRQGYELNNRSYREVFPMSSVQARRELQELLHFGLVTLRGTGEDAVYVLRTPDFQVGNAAVGGAVVDAPTETSAPAYLSHEEKVARIQNTFQQVEAPLSKSELMQHTGLTQGQISPVLKSLRDSGTIELCGTALTSKNAKYRWAD